MDGAVEGVDVGGTTGATMGNLGLRGKAVGFFGILSVIGDALGGFVNGAGIIDGSRVGEFDGVTADGI